MSQHGAAGETGGAFGAARLARMAVTGEAPDVVCTPPVRAETIPPDPALTSAYAERLAVYRSLNRGVAGVVREG